MLDIDDQNTNECICIQRHPTGTFELEFPITSNCLTYSNNAIEVLVDFR